MEAFLVCMWVVVLMGTLGGELRYLLRNDGATLAMLVVAGFFVACFLTRSWLIDRAVFRPTVKRGKKTLQVQLLPAISEVRDYVLGRAAELGIPGTLHVYYIPGTWSSVDAYVFGAGANQIVVVSGGLQALHGVGDATSTERFRFIIDHELGHIAARDTDLLYFARATVLVGAGLLALKLVFLTVLGPDLTLRGYTAVFPSTVEASIIGSPIPIATAPADWFVITFFSLFTALCMGLSAYFYVMIARRREHLADRFAIAHSHDARRAMDAMAHLLAGPALSTAPPHAFLGSVRWHPRAEERLNSIFLSTLASIPEIIGVVMVVLAMMSMRLMLGDITSERISGQNDPAGLIMASAVYALIIGLVIDLLLRDGQSRAHRAQLIHTCGEVLRLFWWTLLVSLALVMIAYLFARPSQLSRFQMEGVQHLLDAELFERTLLFLSAPVTVAAFGVGSLALTPFRTRLSSFSGRAALTLGSSTIAVLLLFLLAAMMARPIAAHRQAAFDEYWKARALAYESGRTTGERALNSLGKQVPELKVAPPSFWPRPDVRELLAEFPMEAQVYAIRIAQPFAPPFSFIALWQAPLRATMI